MRILVGVGAWLLGVATATAGSLLAVSLLGQGIADSPGQQLTAAAVNQALAREANQANQANQASDATPPLPAPVPSASRLVLPQSAPPRSAATQPPATQPRETAATPPPARPSVVWPATSPSPQATGGTVLTSPGGTVLAECTSIGSYLVSWSPTQGYEAGNVLRGPAVTAQVTFDSGATSVTMLVSCSTGTPTVTSTVQAHGVGGQQ
jgi:hypothetical protein